MVAENIGYLSSDLDLGDTVERLSDLPLKKVFREKSRSPKAVRSQLLLAMNELKKGDRFFVASMRCLETDPLMVVTTVRSLTDKGIVVEFVKEGKVFTHLDDPFSIWIASLHANVSRKADAEIRPKLKKDRRLSEESTFKKPNSVKALIKKTSDKPQRKPLTATKIVELKRRASEGENKTALARAFGITREALFSYLRSD